MKYLFFFALVLLSFKGIGQVDNIFCNDTHCGTLEPDWVLQGGNGSVACEGELFSLSPSTSTPYNDIEFFTWILTDTDSGQELQNITYDSGTPLEYLYEIPDSVACEKEQITVEVRLIVQSYPCTEGVSCRYNIKPLTIKLKPRAMFSTAQEFCIDDEIEFEALCVAETYLWDFGDGTTSSDQAASHEYDTPGTYTVSLTVTNECGTDTATRTIVVVEPPVANIDLGSDTGNGCAPGRKQIELNANSGILDANSGQFEWNITPFTTGTNWCFTDDEHQQMPCPDNPAIDFCPCISIDSILNWQSMTTLDLWFFEAGEYELELSYGNVCEMTTTSETITVYDAPEVSTLQDLSGCDVVEVCYSDLNLSVQGDIESYTWTFSGGSIPSFSGADPDFGCVTFNTSGSITLDIVDANSCGDLSQSIMVDVIASGSVSVDDPTAGVICQNAGMIPLNPSSSGGIYTLNGQEVDYIIDDILDPSGLLPGDYTITYVFSQNPDCPVEDEFSFTIEEGPSVELGNNDTACDEALGFVPNIVVADGGIDSWSWSVSNQMGQVVATSTEAMPAFDIDQAGEYTINVEAASDECGTVLDTSLLVVDAYVPASIDDYETLYCNESSNDTLVATPNNGVWSGDGIVNTTTGVFAPSTVSPGIYTITYAIANGACSAEAEVDIEVVASEAVAVVDTFLCEVDMPISLSVMPIGGSFSGQGIVDENQGIFDPSQVGVGLNMVTYYYVDANMCEVAKTIDIEVDAIPTLNVSDTVFVCIGDNDIYLTDLINVDANGEEGEFVFTGEGIVNTEEAIFNGGNLGEGFYTIAVDFYARSCTQQDSFVIELSEKKELIIPTDTTICIDSGVFVLEANLAGGIWSSACGIDPTTGEIDIADIGEGTCNFVYTLDEGTTCEQAQTVEVEILDLANDIEIPNDWSICYQAGTYTIPDFLPLAGEWSGEGIVDATNGIIDVSILQPDSSYIYTYCIESAIIACDACKTTTLSIEPLPTADFELDGAPCEGQVFGTLNNSDGATNYQWDFGDGTPTIDEAMPSYIYQTQGDYTIALTAITSFGCEDIVMQEVHVTAPPTIDAFVMTEEGCAPLEIEYTNNSFGENIAQFWIIDQVDTIFGDHPLIVLDSVATDSIITVELVVYNDCEEYRYSKDVLVHPYPLIDFGINIDENCSPVEVELSNITQGMPDLYQWDFGNGNTSDLQMPPAQIYTTPDDSISVYTISLYAENMCGSSTFEKEVTIYPNNVDAFFELDTLFGCPPLAVGISNYATVGSTVSYDFGDGTTSNLDDVVHIYHEPGMYNITQYASLCGVDSTVSETITVHPLAEVDFQMPSYQCVGEVVAFENLSTGGTVAYWDFGDGGSSDDFNATHIYQQPGEYTITLVVESSFYSCPDTLTKTIFIPERPQAIFSLSETEICPNESIDFLNASIGATNYAWDFGDMAGSEEESPSHTYTNTGTYEVVLTAYDEYGCSIDSSFINLLVHPTPASQFDIQGENFCQFYDTIHVANQSLGYENSIWLLDDAVYTEQNDNIAIAPNEAASYDLSLIAINAFGCRDTSSQTFTVLSSPIAQMEVSDTTGCQPLDVEFTDVSTSSDMRVWHFSAVNTATDDSHIYTYNNYGTFEAILVASNSNQCPNDTLSMAIEVYPRSVASFEIMDFDSCGVPVDLEFVNTSILSDDYNWSINNQSIATVFEPFHTLTNTGQYTITLDANNSYNCPSNAQQIIDIHPQPSAQFDIPITEVCEGDSLYITNTTTNANNYTWMINGHTTQMTPPFVFDEAGEYFLEVVVAHDEFCFDSWSFDQPITVHNTPMADFDYIADESSQILGDVRFVNLSIGADQYWWDFGDQNTSIEENPIHEYDLNGPVVVTLSAVNSQLPQCVDQFTVLVDFERINTFFVPNAISPDQNFGNGEVAIFKPKGVGIESYELNIYSPWGDNIRTLNQVVNGEPVDSWDGNVNGKRVKLGAYPWEAIIYYQSGHRESKKGTITVIR